MHAAHTRWRPSQGAELVLDVAQLVLDMLPPLKDCGQRGGRGGGAAGAGEHPHGQCLPGPRPPAWQPARTGHHHAARGTAHILAGVGVGVRKRSGLTGAPAVNVLSGFSARCMSAALSWNHTRNQASNHLATA